MVMVTRRSRSTKLHYVNNNNNTSICKAHNVSIRAESEAPGVSIFNFQVSRFNQGGSYCRGGLKWEQGLYDRSGTVNIAVKQLGGCIVLAYSVIAWVILL